MATCLRQILALVVEHGLRAFVLNRIAVEQRKQRDLFAHGLKLRGDGVRDKAAERPAEQVVRAGGLNLPNDAQIVLGHLIDRVRDALPAA